MKLCDAATVHSLAAGSFGIGAAGGQGAATTTAAGCADGAFVDGLGEGEGDGDGYTVADGGVFGGEGETREVEVWGESL